MSAAEDDTELRDLLIQNLETSGVLNKLKAEMRAAVFLAMEDQDRLENKTPLVNENLKKCLNTQDGRLVASLIVDFLQVFNLDFSLAVFQPEINLLNGLDSRDLVCRDLGLSDSDLNKTSPLLLELVRRGRRGDKPDVPTEGGGAGGGAGNDRTELLQTPDVALARRTFDLYDQDGSGSVRGEDLKSVFSDLLPGLNRNMLERFTCDELRAADRTSSDRIDFQFFLDSYRRLFCQCRSVVVPDSNTSRPQSRAEDRAASPPVSKIPRYRVQRSQTVVKDPERSSSPGEGDLQQQTSSSAGVRKEEEEEEEEQGDQDEGDSFFDDPLPKPQKTYGCAVPQREDRPSGPIRRGRSLSDLSVLAGDSERDDAVSGPALRKAERSGSGGSPVGFLSEGPRPGGSSASEPSRSRTGAWNSRERGPAAPSARTGSPHLDDNVEYDDDFNSHRSDLSIGELSIGEEIEDVSIEGPENSDKFDETTQDVSVSQLSQSHGADYMEDVS
ncbi:FGFR1 oncogene partner isoform X1 [Nematolebias whitei]|uniref:FGFR1 oncogene partner isoform X1 n=1 Tax=Nematolebias whitei TaxID=451745 RepID=UPI0018986267|nr:FGFR1 oncogene partner isoform X1 [Nematolebias whitei]